MYENAIKNRYEFVMLYDVENGNPNGDPDAGNMPRLDPETGHGIVTDVCIKRKIRNYIDMVKGTEEGFDIYIKQDNVFLADKAKEAKPDDSIKEKADRSISAREYMCKKYYDIRSFGAVLTAFAKKENNMGLHNSAGQVRGPIQLAFGKSVNPIVPQTITITRCAISDAKEEKESNKEDNSSTMLGRKHIIPYALYKQEGFISANLAQNITGFSEDDLELFWQAIENMFEFDRSAARGIMTLRKLIIFKHDYALGNAHAHELFELVKVDKKDDVKIPRAFSDYEIEIGNAPEGVVIIER